MQKLRNTGNRQTSHRTAANVHAKKLHQIQSLHLSLRGVIHEYASNTCPYFVLSFVWTKASLEIWSSVKKYYQSFLVSVLTNMATELVSGVSGWSCICSWVSLSIRDWERKNQQNSESPHVSEVLFSFFAFYEVLSFIVWFQISLVSSATDRHGPKWVRRCYRVPYFFE